MNKILWKKFEWLLTWDTSVFGNCKSGSGCLKLGSQHFWSILETWLLLLLLLMTFDVGAVTLDTRIRDVYCFISLKCGLLGLVGES